jgi:hypothetical protein
MKCIPGDGLGSGVYVLAAENAEGSVIGVRSFILAGLSANSGVSMALKVDS